MNKLNLLAGTAMAVLLTACGGSEEITEAVITGDPITSDIKAELKVWSWDVAAKGLKDTIPSFNKKYPNVTVVVEELGTSDTYQKLMIGLNSNTGLPDVMTIETDGFVKYPPNFPGGFYDLTQVAGSMKQDFDPSKWPAGEYEGKLYALPWDSAPAGIFYRRDFFNKAGVNAIDLNTWDDFINAGKKVQMANPDVKMIPINYAKGSYVHNMLRGQLAAASFNEKGEITLADEKNIKAMELQKRMHNEGLTYNADSWNTLVIATKNNEVATVPYGGWWGGTLKDQMPEHSGKWGFIPFLPAFEDPYFEKGDPYFAGQKVARVLADMVPHISASINNEDGSEAGDYLLTAQSAILLEDAPVKESLEKAAESLKAATGRSIAK